MKNLEKVRVFGAHVPMGRRLFLRDYPDLPFACRFVFGALES